MNSEKVLMWLLAEADTFSDEAPYRIPDLEFLEETLFQLNNRKEINLPTSLPVKIDQMISVLREHFNDNVTLISLVLSYFFPNKFVFYRASSKLEQEIFEGLSFFSDIFPKFGALSIIGKTGFDKYLALNKALISFAEEYWPELDLTEAQAKIFWFLYNGIGKLFWKKSNYSRYWIMGTKEENFEELDNEEEIKWSGRKEMQAGDLVFMYRMSPRKAITALYRVIDDLEFDPFASWDGFWVNLEKVCDIPDVTFAKMDRDPILKDWGLVRSHFQGAMTEPVPAKIYNRLLEEIPLVVRQEHELALESVLPIGYSGQFTSEADFEGKVIVPLLKQWGFQYQPQYPCRFQYGSQQNLCWVDFYVTDGGRPITLFEDKLHIINEKELRAATEQAKSYALQLGLSSFVVASPESLWVYSLERNREKLERKLTSDELKDHDELKALLLKLV